jgi:hypothetical protein
MTNLLSQFCYPDMMLLKPIYEISETVYKRAVLCFPAYLHVDRAGRDYARTRPRRAPDADSD